MREIRCTGHPSGISSQISMPLASHGCHSRSKCVRGLCGSHERAWVARARSRRVHHVVGSHALVYRAGFLPEPACSCCLCVIRYAVVRSGRTSDPRLSIRDDGNHHRGSFGPVILHTHLAHTILSHRPSCCSNDYISSSKSRSSD